MDATRSKTGSKEERVVQRLRRDPLRPVYLFHGRETYFVERCVQAIRQRLVPSADLSDVLVHVFHGSETPVEEILTLARTPPFFHDRQMILVREADKLKDADGSKTSAYLDRPSEESCVVFVAGDTLPKNPLFKVLQKLPSDACIGFPALTPERRREWVLRIAREKGVEDRLSPDVLAGFLEEAFVALSVIEQRLEMLSLFHAGKDAPGGEVPLPPEWSGGVLEKGFLFTDALLDGNEGEALTLLHRFLVQGTAPMLILSRITWEIRRIRQVQEARRRGATPEAAVSAAGIQPFKRNRYLALANGIPAPVIDRLFFSLGETDRVMKSSRTNLQWHLEDLCVRIMRAVPRR